MKPTTHALRAIGMILILSMICGCSTKNSGKTSISERFTVEGIILADTIIYDVTITLLDSSNKWECECLKGVRQKSLVDYIFNQIYAGRFTAYNFSDGEQLTTRELQKIEQTNGFNRQLISKIQFKELWHTDTSGTLKKEILEMTLGYASYSNQHTFLGHKGLFNVKTTSNNK